MSSNQSLSIGRHRINVQSISQKLTQDIAFLSERITRMVQQTTPNTVVLHTYRTMLESRQAVLDWLEKKPMTNSVESDSQYQQL